MNQKTAEPKNEEPQPDLQPAKHSDDQRSQMPERGDDTRKQSPADKPGKKPGEGEPPVG